MKMSIIARVLYQIIVTSHKEVHPEELFSTARGEVSCLVNVFGNLSKSLLASSSPIINRVVVLTYHKLVNFDANSCTLYGGQAWRDIS
jgi:hypothetical protein